MLDSTTYELKRCPRCGKEEIFDIYRDSQDTVIEVYAVCPDNHAIRVLNTSAVVRAAMG